MAPALIRQPGGGGLARGHADQCQFSRLRRRRGQGRRGGAAGQYDLQSTEIEERIDARQRAYYWIGLRRRKAVPPPDSDLGAVYGD